MSSDYIRDRDVNLQSTYNQYKNHRCIHLRSMLCHTSYRPRVRLLSVVEGIEELKMPNFMDVKEGQLGKWKKKAGDSFQRGDCLCDITLDRVIVGVDAKEAGILAKIVVSDYQTAPINSTIALLASDMNEYMDFVANEMADSYDAELQKAVNEVAEAKGKKPDMTVLMRVINHLIKCGSIKQGSDYAKSLQSLAVKGDDRLMSIFIASSDGSGHDEDSFDEARFIENTSDYINDLSKEKSNL